MHITHVATGKEIKERKNISKGALFFICPAIRGEVFILKETYSLDQVSLQSNWGLGLLFKGIRTVETVAYVSRFSNRCEFMPHYLHHSFSYL